MAEEQVNSSLEDVLPDDEQLATANTANGINGDVDDEDEDEDDVTTGSRRQKAGDGAEAQDADDAADDLFGDDDGSELGDLDKSGPRELDDAELDSGDDMDRNDRAPEQEDAPTQQFEEQTINTMDIEITRQPLPEPSDGELYLLKVPAFLTIEPEAWQTTTFQPPTTDHHSKAAPTATFSAYNTALSTIRWRHSPSNPSELQSNARINRWSDGSVTLQLASDPSTQYEIDGNPLAPPQRDPIKPTPTSIAPGQKVGQKYDQKKDAYTYLVVPVESAESLRVTHKITAGLTVRQTESVTDDAIERLQAALSQAANATKVGGASGQLEATETDPELQRKQAEIAEKLQMRDRKKREHAQERERLRTDRTLGRSGLSTNRYGGGLNVGMLEDEEMEGRGRSQGTKARAKPRRRRNSEYSEDEDFGNKRFSKEDSYDQEDDFVAPSDEEEVVEDDDDEDDGIVESQKERTPKRDRPRPAETTGSGNDEDAEGEEDDEVPQARTKRRRIVDDEDDEE